MIRKERVATKVVTRSFHGSGALLAPAMRQKRKLFFPLNNSNVGESTKRIKKRAGVATVPPYIVTRAVFL